MSLSKIGNIFVDKPARITIGALSYDYVHEHAMAALDLAALLPVCRNTEEVLLRGCCIPYMGVKEPPYLSSDLQICGHKGKRIKVGYVYTASDQRGPAYQVVIDVKVVLKQWDCAWVHFHNLTEEELKEQAKEKNAKDMLCAETVQQGQHEGEG